MPRPKPNAFSNEVTYGVSRYLADRDEQYKKLRADPTRPKLEVVNKAKDSGPAELRIYDAIGGWFGITATEVAEALDDIDDDRALTVRLNSPGGDVFDGTAIYNLLRAHPGPVDVVVDGLAASAASFIAQAGDTITMNRGTQMMIHDAIGFTIGNANDHREQVALLDRISDEIAGIYAARAGESIADWRVRMLATTWYSAAEAVEVGLADKATDDEQADSETEEDQEQEQVAAVAAVGFRADLTEHATSRRHSCLMMMCPGYDQPEPAADPFAALDDAVFASLGETLDDLFDPVDGYDPATLGSLIADVYDNAPAPPAIPPGPARPRTDIPIGELVDAIVAGIQEGVRP